MEKSDNLEFKIRLSWLVVPIVTLFLNVASFLTSSVLFKIVLLDTFKLYAWILPSMLANKEPVLILIEPVVELLLVVEPRINFWDCSFHPMKALG